ncbi:hypothetical protein [Cellulophaga omnivescoria]|uniref:hypothetical protein n=1 Tax=Cellulophaga omnivescoria TaxID=1888890 RepID=UPI0022F13668|nr:hypothetical protein [Cellulophaga omnivescoria]WBU89726.1 hypothetical protein PBN93_01615 [Cellulophaga omnivescoria]
MQLDKLILVLVITITLGIVKTQAQKIWKGDLAIENLEDFTSGEYTEVDGNIIIEEYQGTDLTVLTKLEKCSGNIVISDNEKLESLKGLENLKAVGGSFSLINNPELYSYCALQKELITTGIKGIEITKGIIEKIETQDNGYNPSIMSLQNNKCSAVKFRDFCFSC